MIASKDGMPAPKGGSGTTRDVLTRVLALEARNALARVELAASELQRFEIQPGVAERLATIADAVGDLDGLLGRIGRLWSPPVAPRSQSIAVERLLDEATRRLAPVLRARGISLRTEPGGVARCTLACSPPTIERLVFAYLRLVLADESARGAWWLGSRIERGRLWLELRRPAASSIATASPEGPRALDLELQLAELGGGLRPAPSAPQLFLPVSGEPERKEEVCAVGPEAETPSDVAAREPIHG